MPSYIVRDGNLLLREKDNNIPSYRIIPYHSIHTPTHNDYVNSTIQQLKSQLHKLNQDYLNLTYALWKTLSQIDSTQYDPNIMFYSLSQQQIYHQLATIRNINNQQQQEQQSLTLSAIIKVDQNSITTSPRQPFLLISQNSNMGYNVSEQCNQNKSIVREIKQESLYQIQQEEENHSNNTSNVEEQGNTNHNNQQHQQQCKFLPLIKRKPSSLSSQYQQPLLQPSHNNNNQPNQQQQLQSNKHSPPHHSHLSQTGQRQSTSTNNRRTSFLLKQKISIALHEQQQLRQILQQQLQKLTQQLDEKNQYLTWTIQQLKLRNQLIQKLKQTILLRDQALLQQQKQLNNKYNNNNNNNNNRNYEDNIIDAKQMIIKNRQQSQILEQKDREIGLLINSLIQRTDQTHQDFQYLTKSIQHHHQQQQLQLDDQQQRQQDSEIDKTIDIQQLQRSVRQNPSSMCQSISVVRDQSIVNKLNINKQQYPQQYSSQIRSSSQHNSNSNSHHNSNSNSHSIEQQSVSNGQTSTILQPKVMNHQSNSHYLNNNNNNMNKQSNNNISNISNTSNNNNKTSNNTITYLTKEHFLQAQRKQYNPILLSNVKMTQSINIINSNNNTNNE